MAKKFPYYPQYVDDFDEDKNVRAMNLAEIGLYQLMLNKAWKLGSLPDNPEATALAISRKPNDVKKCWTKVRLCWVPNCEPGQIVNPRQERERIKALDKSVKAIKAVNSRPDRRHSVATEKTNSGSTDVDQEKTFPVQPRAYGSDSSSKDSTREPGLIFDLEAGFREVWDAYPRKGRTLQSDSRVEYVALMFPLPLEEQLQLQVDILGAIRGKWATSTTWAKGFIMRLKDWIHNRRWDEDPEQTEAADSDQQAKPYKPEWEQ